MSTSICNLHIRGLVSNGHDLNRLRSVILDTDVETPGLIENDGHWQNILPDKISFINVDRGELDDALMDTLTSLSLSFYWVTYSPESFVTEPYENIVERGTIYQADRQVLHTENLARNEPYFTLADLDNSKRRQDVRDFIAARDIILKTSFLFAKSHHDALRLCHKHNLALP